ncbi:MAG: lysophospholipid acyltransferase family protein [Ignavibacteriaceae bacterium]|jgi:1-acyl-sn-glycerol-3-phosphate acyltransferase
MITYIKIFVVGLYIFFCSTLALLSAIFDRSNRTYFWVSRLISNGGLFLSGIKLTTSGLENIDASKPYVYVSNHSSMFDILAMQASFPNDAVIIFKKELAKIPIFGWALQLGPYIVVDRQKADRAMESLDRAKKTIVEKGISVLVFAEGTRSKTGEVQPFKRGAFYLAARVGYPIIPVSISGTAAIMPKGKLRINKGTIHVHYDTPINTEHMNGRQGEKELMEQVRQIIIANKKD